MARIKILFVSQSARIAGAEVMLSALVRALDPERFEAVVAFSENGPLKDALENSGIRTVLCPMQWWIGAPLPAQPFRRGARTLLDALSTARRLPPEISRASRSAQARVAAWEAMLRREKPDLVHTNTLAIWESALAARLCGIPHLWHAHETVRDSPAHRAVLPLPLFFWIVARFSRHVVAVSSWHAQQLGIDIAPEKIAVIENGIEAPQAANVAAQQIEVRRELGLAPDALIALTVATMTPEKGHFLLLQAAHEARARNADLHFVVAGRAARAKATEFRRAVARLGLVSRVRYLGARDDVPRLMNAADMVVIPSEVETFSLVLVEAMAHGKAVVATRCGGPQTIVRDGETGFLVPTGDAASLGERISRLAGDGALRARLGAAAQREFEQKYHIDRCAARFAEVYRDILAEPEKFDFEEQALIETLVRCYEISENQALRRWRAALAAVALPAKTVRRKMS